MTNMIDTIFYFMRNNVNFIIALIVTYIAVAQYFLARQNARDNNAIAGRKLKLDLFDKRFVVFRGVRRFIGAVISKVDVEDAEIRHYVVSTMDAHFLFEREVREYLSEILKNAMELKTNTVEMDRIRSNSEIVNNPPKLSMNEYAERDSELLMWFSDQLEYYGGLYKIFSPYLKFDNVFGK